jgi:hypothetical protein
MGLYRVMDPREAHEGQWIKGSFDTTPQSQTEIGDGNC